MKKEEVFCLYQELATLSDNRRVQGKRHKIELIVTVVILSIMNGFNGFHAIDDFVKKHANELISIFNVNKNRLPSYSTIRRNIGRIDFDELNNIFENWTKKHINIDGREWISLDGKEIRGSNCGDEKRFVNMVSLFFVNKKQVYMMGKVDVKSNEIPKVQELISSFHGANVVFRMDAMHCQKKTVEKILEKESFYVLEVKNNQKELLKKVEFISKYVPEKSKNTTCEINRGRIETRQVSVHKECLDLCYYGWTNVKNIIKVKRNVQYKTGKTSEETAYFITNLEENATYFNKNIREHWKIENSLHYIKDVVFKEDKQKIRTQQAPQNMSLLITLVINVFRQNGQEKITQSIRQLTGNIIKTIKLLDIKTDRRR
jgi:predicted transposase YbfD/YdcC